MDITKIFNPGYLLDPNPGISFEYFPYFATIFGILLLGGILLYFYIRFFATSELFRRAYRPLPGKLFTYGLIGFILLFFRSQGAPYLSMRIWLLLYIVLLIILLYRSIKTIQSDLNDRRYLASKRTNVKEDSYLPTPKKRKSKKRK